MEVAGAEVAHGRKMPATVAEVDFDDDRGENMSSKTHKAE